MHEPPGHVMGPLRVRDRERVGQPPTVQSIGKYLKRQLYLFLWPVYEEDSDLPPSILALKIENKDKIEVS